MTPALETAIRAHAAREHPREACGLLLRREGAGEEYRPCRNTAAGQAHFIMHPEDIAAAEADGHLVGIVHSHPDSAPSPSEADRVMMERWGVPWWIVGGADSSLVEHRPTGYRAPLIGRTFSHGVLDCYALIRDYYAEVLGLELPDYQRADNWWNAGGNLYLDNFEAAGFRDVTGHPLAQHDVLLMEFQAKVPNHAGIYLGGDVLLHHLMRRLSRRETYSGYWARITRKVVRHASRC